MKKYISHLLLLLILTQIFFSQGFVEETLAISVDYDFSNATDYTVSDTTKSYIHGGAAKLKGSLTHRAHVENGPAAMDWGTNVIVDGNYAYVTGYGSHAVTSIDITDPSSLSSAGYIGAGEPKRLYGAYDLKKVGDYIYVASLIDDDMEVIDASDPTNLIHHGRFVDTGTSQMNGVRGIDVVGDFAYLAAYTDDALQILDISNPASPVERGNLKDSIRLNGAMSVKVVGDYAYVTSYIGDSLQIIDISDPDNPVFAAEIVDDATTELNGAGGLDIVGNFAYVAAYNDDGLEIINISVPTNPIHVGEIQNTDPGVFLNGAREIEVIGDYAYISSYVDDALEIIDISVPANPTHAGTLDTNSFGRLDATFGIAVDGTDVYMTSYTNGTLQSIDASTPSAPVFQDELESGPVRLGNAVGVKVEGDYAYVASYGSNGLEILDISDSANPTHVSSLTDDSSNNELFGSWDLEKDGDYLYVSGYSDSGIEVIDVSTPTSPIGVARILDSGTAVELQNPRGLAIEGNFLYAVSYNGDSLQIIDITTPTVPIARGYYKDATVIENANDVQIFGNYAFITAYLDDRVVVLDITNPDNPVYETELLDAAGLELNGVWDLQIDGNYAYVSSYVDDAIVILDISDPTNPIYMGDFDDDGTTRFNGPRGIVYDEGYAYLTAYIDDTVLAFDVSDPTTPLFIDELRNIDLYDTSSKIDKKDNDLFFTQYVGSSLSIVRESYPNDSPFVIPNLAVNATNLNSINETYGTYNQGDVTFQISKDNGTNWYYFDGTSWVITTGGSAQSNTSAIINGNNIAFNSIAGGTNQLKWKAFLNSNGSRKVELTNISMDTIDVDTTPPNIIGSNFGSGALLPGGNHIISLNYEDSESGIDTASASLKLQKWDGISAWGADISGSFIGTPTVGTGSANYPTVGLDFGKYKYTFLIDDNAGNNTTVDRDFYIDEPEFIVGSGSIDIGVVDHLATNFSDTVSITVHTVGAPFDLTFTNTTSPAYNTENIPTWDGTEGFGYQQAPYSGTPAAINTDQLIASEPELINTNGNKNTYTYDIQLGALVDILQAGGEYLGDLKFDIDLEY